METKNTLQDISRIARVLRLVYDSETAYPEVSDKWDKSNPTLGQCAVTALVVQHYFGGEIYKHNHMSHYFNKIDGEIIDLTKDQFDISLDYSDSHQKQPDTSKANTQNRFNLLLSRVDAYIKLEDQLATEIVECKKCGDLPKLSCNSIKIGKSNILVLGESPAKDGWIVSGKAFYNKDGKLQASGKVLEKLLNLCGLSIENIYFTEACKCIISDRKTLSLCCQNCKQILLKQLELIDCDIILSMGIHPTQALLNQKITKLSDVVGKQFKLKIGDKLKIVIPIYHTSPINPLGFKGNKFIFEKTLSGLINN